MSLAKKVLLLFPVLLLTTPFLFSCNQKDPNTIYLKVLNSEDYIDTSIITDFERECSNSDKKVKVIYETFDTMENMYNTLKTGKTSYDLVCASDYMVQKLVNLDLIEKLEYKNLTTYEQNVSPFIHDRLQGITWGNEYNLWDYCSCYMWGTLGILYNPNYSVFQQRHITNVIEDMESYNSLWNKKYYKTISIKDSMRDTYAIGLIHRYQDELMQESDVKKRQQIFDRGGEDDGDDAKEHIKEIESDLLKLRNNVFGFEVDSGKEDIVTEKIGIDTAWSGDAVKAIRTAETDKKMELRYTIPKEGSNLWFDCWTIQKKSKNKDLAYQFLEYLSKPINVIKNMEAIGFTSSIATNEIFDYYNELYKAKSGATSEPYDLGYFFSKTGEEKIIQADVSYIGRQLSAQFPQRDDANRLMVMKDYGKNNDLILKMWEEVKYETLPAWAIALFSIEITLIVAGITVIAVLRIRNKNQRRAHKNKTV